MKYRDPSTGNFRDLHVKVSDTLPIGAEIDYDGETVPDGWEEIAIANIIQAGITETITSTFNPEEKITLNKQINKIGTKLTLNNGNIVIGSGVSYVKISVNASPYLSTASSSKSYCRIRIMKNNNALSDSLSVRADNIINRPQLSIVNQIVQVQEGDKLSVHYYNNTSDLSSALESSGFWITVEVVE